MKKRTLILATVCCFLLGATPVMAAESNDVNNYIAAFVEEISKEADYAIWTEATPVFGYELYGADLENVVGNLYYMKSDGNDVGYVIINKEGNAILEFSVAMPAYDNISENLNTGDVKRIYVNAMPAVLNGSTYSELIMSGETLKSFDIFSGATLMYNPQEQGGKNCIVGAISNLMWYWSENGYSSLANNMTFAEVEEEIDSLISSHGGYANKNIPDTIKDYVKGKNNSYSATVTNKWSPSFSNVKTEVGSRPCLLGFAAGSPYSDKDGHMTVCVGTRTINGVNYCKVMDGWSTEIVEKSWGTYNDFMSKVKLSK